MKTVDLNLIIEKEPKAVIWESSSTINIVEHINAYFTLNNIKIKTDLDGFVDIINNFGYSEEFKEKMKEIFIELDDKLINYKHKDGKIIADPMNMYYSDINISYNNGYFSIVISRESARGKLLKTWEANLKKIGLKNS